MHDLELMRITYDFSLEPALEFLLCLADSGSLEICHLVFQHSDQQSQSVRRAMSRQLSYEFAKYCTISNYIQYSL